jgi:hypothetical protein
MSLLRKIQSRQSWTMPDVRRKSKLTMEMGLGGQLRLAHDLNDMYIPSGNTRGFRAEALKSRPGRAARTDDPYSTVPIRKSRAFGETVQDRRLRERFSTE